MTSPDDLRIGDAERDTAMAALREHYAQGRLTHEELDERLELTLSARTGRDLSLAGADLPELYGSHPGGLQDHGGPEYRGRGRARPHGAAGWDEDRGAWGRGPWHHGRDPRRGPHHPAAWRHHHMARRGGPPVAPILILLLVVGMAAAGFGALKLIFLAWLAMAVLGMLHRRRGHPQAGDTGAPKDMGRI